MITRVSSIPPMTWPTGWEDVEVVDSVIVEEPPPAASARFGARDPDARAYDRFGAMAAGPAPGAGAAPLPAHPPPRAPGGGALPPLAATRGACGPGGPGPSPAPPR